MATITAKNKLNLGLSDEKRNGVVGVLSAVLADQYLLYTKLRNYHWNVIGPEFRSLHQLFEEQYTTLEKTIDETAERIRAYGANAIGTMSEFSEHTRLNEVPGEYPDAGQMVMNLMNDHEMMVRNLRDDVEICGQTYKDVGSEDFLTGMLQDHQEMAWMLRTFLEGQGIE